MKIVNSGMEFVAEHAAMFGPPENFRPTVIYIPDGDCIEFFAKPGEFYGKRIDDVVTVYLRRDNDEIVGSLIKGIKDICEKILARCPGFKIEIEHGRTLLEHIFLAYLWTSDVPRDPMIVKRYRDLIEVAEESRLEANLCTK